MAPPPADALWQGWATCGEGRGTTIWPVALGPCQLQPGQLPQAAVTWGLCIPGELLSISGFLLATIPLDKLAAWQLWQISKKQRPGFKAANDNRYLQRGSHTQMCPFQTPRLTRRSISCSRTRSCRCRRWYSSNSSSLSLISVMLFLRSRDPTGSRGSPRGFLGVWGLCRGEGTAGEPNPYVGLRQVLKLGRRVGFSASSGGEGPPAPFDSSGPLRLTRGLPGTSLPSRGCGEGMSGVTRGLAARRDKEGLRGGSSLMLSMFLRATRGLSGGCNRASGTALLVGCRLGTRESRGSRKGLGGRSCRATRGRGATLGISRGLPTWWSPSLSAGQGSLEPPPGRVGGWTVWL